MNGQTIEACCHAIVSQMYLTDQPHRFPVSRDSGLRFRTCSKRVTRAPRETAERLSV